MVQLTLYGLDFSPPVRACLLTLKALNLPYEYKPINLLEKEHLSDEYMKLNPQHCIPTLVDSGHVLWDSHAIMAYLVGKYAKDDLLYPKDLLERALVDMRLHFECGVMFEGGLRKITIPMFFRKNNQIPQHQIDYITEIYDMLEIFLKDKRYVAGNHLTIADFSVVATATSLVAFVDIDSSKYPKITTWLKRMATLPYYQEANGNGAKQLVEMINSKGFTIAI